MKKIPAAYILVILLTSFIYAQKPDYTILNHFTRTKNEIKSDSIWNSKEQKIERGTPFTMRHSEGKLLFNCYTKTETQLGGIPAYSRMYSSAQYYDFSYKLEYKIIESKKMSFLQVRVRTYGSNVRRAGNLLLKFTPGGELFISRDDVDLGKNIKYTSEICKSIKPLGEINKVEVIRKLKDLFVIINGDTVKRLIDEDRFEFSSAGIFFGGDQIIELDNVETNLYFDNTKKTKVLAELMAMNGQYEMKKQSCTEGSIGTFNVGVKFTETFLGDKYQCQITGLTDTPLTRPVYLSGDHGFDLDMNNLNTYYKIGGKDYTISKLFFSNGIIYCHLSLVIIHNNIGDVSMLNCDLNGTKIK